MNRINITNQEFPSLYNETSFPKSLIANKDYSSSGGYNYKITVDGYGALYFKDVLDRDLAFEKYFINNSPTTISTENNKTNKMNTITEDIKSFIKEHKNVIYYIVIILLVDHFFLNGKLREKTQALIEKLLGNVEKKINAVGNEK